jgi:predicted ATPase
VSGLVVELLSRNAVETLVAHKLGVRAVARALADFIFERAGDIPLYSEELTLALRAFGFIERDGDACRLPDTGLDGVELTIPDTLQGAIVSRIDRLATVEQLTLKVASVIGRRFSIALLRELHPLPTSWRTMKKFSSNWSREISFGVTSAPSQLFIFLSM